MSWRRLPLLRETREESALFVLLHDRHSLTQSICRDVVMHFVRLERRVR